MFVYGWQDVRKIRGKEAGKSSDEPSVMTKKDIMKVIELTLDTKDTRGQSKNCLAIAAKEYPVNTTLHMKKIATAG